MCGLVGHYLVLIVLYINQCVNQCSLLRCTALRHTQLLEFHAEQANEHITHLFLFEVMQCAMHICLAVSLPADTPL